MRIVKLSNGNLEMTADTNEQHDLQAYIVDSTKEGLSIMHMQATFIMDYLGCDPMGDEVDYWQVWPKDVGCLTDAPLITDGNNVYGYMNYTVANLLDLLALGETITWQKG